jgi:hypothetical protein
LLPSVRLALLVSRALACGDLIQSAPFRFHPHVGVAREHGARSVPGDAHDRLVASAGLGKFREQRVAVVVLAAREPGGRVRTDIRLSKNRL